MVGDFFFGRADQWGHRRRHAARPDLRPAVLGKYARKFATATEDPDRPSSQRPPTPPTPFLHWTCTHSGAAIACDEVAGGTQPSRRVGRMHLARPQRSRCVHHPKNPPPLSATRSSQQAWVGSAVMSFLSRLGDALRSVFATSTKPSDGKAPARAPPGRRPPATARPNRTAGRRGRVGRAGFLAGPGRAVGHGGDRPAADRRGADDVFALDRRRARPGRGRLDLGAVRGAGRPRQGPAGAGRRRRDGAAPIWRCS